MSYKYIAITKEWRDKINGNSYFSSIVEDLSGNIILKLPFQYGYGTQSELEIRDKLTKTFSLAQLSFYQRHTFKPKCEIIKFIKIDRCTKKEVQQHAKEL